MDENHDRERHKRQTTDRGLFEEATKQQVNANLKRLHVNTTSETHLKAAQITLAGGADLITHVRDSENKGRLLDQ